MQIIKHWHYLMVPWFGYFQNPNQLHFAYLFTNYPKNLGGLLRPFKTTLFGYKWNYHKGQSFYYMKQEMKPFSEYKIRTYLQEVFTANRPVEVNVSEALNKSSLIFQYDLISEQPDIFTDSFVDNPDNFVYLKFIQKRRRNKVDTDHCSKLLMERAINHDKLYSTKVGIKINKPYDHEYLLNNLSFHASTEMASNFTGQSYSKTKVFMRYLQRYHNLAL